MGAASTSFWSALEAWRSRSFLVAGGLLLASPTHVGLELFLEVPLPSWLVALFVLPGLLASLLGLAGLYPSLGAVSPRLALAGGLSAAAAGATLVALLAWTLGSALLAAASGGVARSPPGVLFVAVAVTMTLAFVLFGVASLRAGVPSRGVGRLLLSFAAPWAVVLAATPIYGAAFPGWLVLAIYGPVPVVVLAVGYALRGDSAPARRRDAAVDVAARYSRRPE